MHHPQGSRKVPEILLVSLPSTALCYFRTAEFDISWRHPTKLSALTIEVLAQRYGLTIRDFQISNFTGEIEPLTDTLNSPIYGLEKLHATDMDPKCSPPIVSQIFLSSNSSLKHLKLGCEKFIARPCLLGGSPLAEENLYEFTDDVLGEFENALIGNERQRDNRHLQLQTLHLIGFDFRKLTADSEASFLELSGLSRLNALTLESCFIQGSPFSLLSPQTTPGSIWIPRLQSFSLRYEKSDATFQHQVRAFLGSFTGLVHLSVLLEGSGGYMKPDCFIENHGKTLKTLVWDLRSEPRTSIRQSTNIPDDSPYNPCTYAIAAGCPGLWELGLSLVAYDDELPYRVSRHSYHPSLNGHQTYIDSGTSSTSTAKRSKNTQHPEHYRAYPSTQSFDYSPTCECRRSRRRRDPQTRNYQPSQAKHHSSGDNNIQRPLAGQDEMGPGKAPGLLSMPSVLPHPIS